MSRQQFLDAYAISGDMRTAAAVAGVNMLTAFRMLKISGAALVSDRLKFGTDGQKLGARAEMEFQIIVPEAKQMNTNQRQHPGFDFMVGKSRIDVKASSIGRRAGWKFTVNPCPADGYRADYYVLMAALVGQTLSAGYELYIIPREMIESSMVGTICIQHAKKSAHWSSEFRCSPGDAAGFFADVQGAP